MKACVDVHYEGSRATAACVLFRDWSDSEPASERVISLSDVAPYESGQFFKRELPCVLAVLRAVESPVDLVVIDGYVWLAEQKPGLGAHLFDSLGASIPVIGVAKSRFVGAPAIEIARASSRSPLYITAAGIDVRIAAEHVRSMHGDSRLPTLLRRVDQLSRGRAA